MQVKINQVEHRYLFLVITETDDDRRPAGKHQPYAFFHTGEIVICQVDLDGGGIPIEVGTWAKPGKQNCKYETFERLSDAIDCSYAVAHGEWENDKVRPRKRYNHGGKRRKKFRHKA